MYILRVHTNTSHVDLRFVTKKEAERNRASLTSPAGETSDYATTLDGSISILRSEIQAAEIIEEPDVKDVRFGSFFGVPKRKTSVPIKKPTPVANPPLHFGPFYGFAPEAIELKRVTLKATANSFGKKSVVASKAKKGTGKAKSVGGKSLKKATGAGTRRGGGGGRRGV